MDSYRRKMNWVTVKLLLDIHGMFIYHAFSKEEVETLLISFQFLIAFKNNLHHQNDSNFLFIWNAREIFLTFEFVYGNYLQKLSRLH